MPAVPRHVATSRTSLARSFDTRGRLLLVMVAFVQSTQSLHQSHDLRTYSYRSLVLVGESTSNPTVQPRDDRLTNLVI